VKLFKGKVQRVCKQTQYRTIGFKVVLGTYIEVTYKRRLIVIRDDL